MLSTSRARFRIVAFIMKPNRTRPGKPAVITNSRWLAYATAGAASAFTGANSADATIHYSGPINQIFNSCAKTATFQLDRLGDFIRLRHTQLGCFSYNGTGLFNVGARAGAWIAGFYSSRLNVISASNLKHGQFISNRPFIPAQSRSAVLVAESSGQFNGGGIGYVGFKFNNGSGDQYGWVRIQTRPLEGEGHPFKLRDYAYGDVGDRVRAGQISSNEMVPEENEDVIPQEGSLGALALGAAGLLAWRKRRSQAAL